MKYTDDEIGVWKHCYPKLKSLLKINACDETNYSEDLLDGVKGWTFTDGWNEALWIAFGLKTNSVAPMLRFATIG